MDSDELQKKREEFYANVVELRSRTAFTLLEQEQRKAREKHLQLNESKMKDSHRTGEKHNAQKQ